MHIVGTKKVRFVNLQKNGSTSLRTVLKENTAIKGWYTTDKDENHRYPYKDSALQNKNITFIFPLRDPIKRKKSAILQKIHAKFGSVNNLKDLERHVKGFLKQYLKYGDKLTYWHCDLFKKFIYDIFRRLGHEVYYLTREKPNRKLNFNHKYMMFSDVVNDQSESFDVVILAGFEVHTKTLIELKRRRKNSKIHGYI